MNRSILMAAAAWLVAASTGLAQVGVERFDRQLEQIQRENRQKVDTSVPADQRLLIDYGGYLTFNFLAADDPQQNTHILRQTDLIGYARINLDGVHEFFVRARTTYVDFNQGDSYDGLGDDYVEPTLDRGFYRFDLKRAMASYQGEVVPYNFVLQGGRQLVHWANGLVLSQELDGVVTTLEYDAFSLDLLAGAVRDSTTDIDSSRPNYDKNTDRAYYGGTLTYRADAKHSLFVYGLVQEDHNGGEELVVDVFGAESVTRFKYDSFYVGVGARGNLTDNILYSVEAVYQGGSTLSSSFTIEDGFAQIVDQTEDDISAAAIDIQLDYLFNDANRSRLTGEVLVASGDEDRLHTTNTFGGNAPGTNDNAFNGFGLSNTGLAFAPTASNLLMIRAGASTFPFPTSETFQRLQVGLNLYGYFKTNPDAPIDEVTSNQSYLGFEADLYINWQVTSDLSLSLRYGVFLPGDAIGGELQPNDGDDRHFFYTGVTLAF